jgi:putative ABC transport system ATP-binding protein
VRLEFRDVVKHYRTESEVVRAVDGLSLTVEDGEFVAIYGPSGSGKTTLLMLAAAILTPDSGRVSVDGRDLAALSADEAARYRLLDVGFVFQSFHLMGSVSVLDNAAVKLLLAGASPAEARQLVEPWLERLGLGHRIDHKPNQLSAGERQRVAIARALSNDPKLVLADEPTGNLDTQRGRAVLALMGELARDRNMPVILVTHDPEAIELVDRAYVLRDGQLLERLDTAPTYPDFRGS